MVCVLIIAAIVIILAAARCLARALGVMATVAAGIGAVAAILGPQITKLFDAPEGPSIIYVAILTLSVGPLLRDTA